MKSKLFLLFKYDFSIFLSVTFNKLYKNFYWFLKVINTWMQHKGFGKGFRRNKLCSNCERRKWSQREEIGPRHREKMNSETSSFYSGSPFYNFSELPLQLNSVLKPTYHLKVQRKDLQSSFRFSTSLHTKLLHIEPRKLKKIYSTSTLSDLLALHSAFKLKTHYCVTFDHTIICLEVNYMKIRKKLPLVLIGLDNPV